MYLIINMILIFLVIFYITFIIKFSIKLNNRLFRFFSRKLKSKDKKEVETKRPDDVILPKSNIDW